MKNNNKRGRLLADQITRAFSGQEINPEDNKYEQVNTCI